VSQFEPQAPPDRTGKPHRVRTVVLLVIGVLLAAAGVSWAVGTHYAAMPANQTIPGVVTKSATPTPLGTVAPTQPPATEAAPTTAPPVKLVETKASRYLAVLHDQYPDTEGVADSVWISLAKSACDVLKEGGTKTDIMLTLMADYDEDTSPVVAYAIGAGVQAYCPRYSFRVTGNAS
jgi:hypothetical protein